MADDMFRFPDGKALIRRDQIGRVQAFETGVGCFAVNDRMVDWLPTKSPTIAQLVVEMLAEVFASNGRIAPDWAILDLEDEEENEAGDKSDKE